MISKVLSLFLLINGISLIFCYPAFEDIQFQPFEEDGLEKEVGFEVPHLIERRAVREEAIQLEPLEEEYEYPIVDADVPLVRERRQLFGGRSGSQQTIGYKAGPAWGSMSHSGGPITYSGGADFNRNGHGLSGSLSHTPGVGAHGSVRGTVGILNTPNHQVSGWAQHDRNFNTHLRRLGPETNSAGLDYQHGSGASAFISGSKTPGFPSSGTVGGSIPLHSSPTSSVSLSGSSTFSHGSKPNNQIMLHGSKSF